MSKFEIDVLAQIDRCLYDPKTGVMIPVIAKFFSGTLFVKCDVEVARKIWHALCKEHGVGNLLLTKVSDDEFAYDFI